METLKFNKEGKLWYIDLPEWTGHKSDLLMVAGADTFLDVLDSKNENTVSLEVSQSKFEGSNIKLTKLLPVYGGATYFVKSKVFKSVIWLCKVTKFVFDGKLPKTLYVQAKL
jgi:hypothetical protein